MNKTIEGPSLVPLERVASPTLETTDKATRRMITQIKNALGSRISLQPTGRNFDYRTRRFVGLQAGDNQSEVLLSASLGQPNYTLPNEGPLLLISGMCLFGASGLSAQTQDGQVVSITDPLSMPTFDNGKLQKVQAQLTLHVSEVETILRISSAIKTVLAGQVPSHSQTTELLFHLPTLEYKLNILSLVERGLLSADQFIVASKLIEQRSQALLAILGKRLPIEIKVESPLLKLSPLLEKDGVTTSLSSCLAILREDSTMNPLLQISQPRTFDELSKLSYAANYIKAAQRAQLSEGGCLAIDIAEEAPILDNAVRLLAELGLPLSMAALYVAPQTVTLNGRHGKQALFMHQPNGETPLQELRLVVSNGKTR